MSHAHGHPHGHGHGHSHGPDHAPDLSHFKDEAENWDDKPELRELRERIFNVWMVVNPCSMFDGCESVQSEDNISTMMYQIYVARTAV